MTTVAQELPDLEELLREAGRPDLADQVPGLEIRQRCQCSVEGCRSFHTAAAGYIAGKAGDVRPRRRAFGATPMKRWFRRGKQVPAGDYVVDTIDGEIVYVEVLRLD